MPPQSGKPKYISTDPNAGLESAPKYLSTDPNAGLESAPTNTAEPPKPSFYSRLTAPYNPEVEEYAAKHPILGPAARFFDAAGAAVMAFPENVYQGVRHPLESAKGIASSLNAYNPWNPSHITARGAMSVLPEALGQGVGNVAGGEMLKAAPKSLPDVDLRTPIAKAFRTNEGTGPIKSIKDIIPGALVPRLDPSETTGILKGPSLSITKSPYWNRMKPAYRNTPFAGPEPLGLPGTTGAAAKPFEPMIWESPEEAASHDFRMKNIERQASSAGKYHAAQGASGKRLNLQQRIARRESR